jgi:hypothetical protein
MTPLSEEIALLVDEKQKQIASLQKEVRILLEVIHRLENMENHVDRNRNQ